MLQGPDDMLMWDEGGLLIPEHIPVEQKISTTGTYGNTQTTHVCMLNAHRQEVLRS